MTNKIIVIGGGASGIIAAWRSASLGVPTILIEKNSNLGSKILISGGGKCNITHSGNNDTLLKGFRKNEANFLKPAFYKFSNDDILKLLASRGLRAEDRGDGKIFPVNGRASDVVDALKSCLEAAGVQIRLNTDVEDVLTDNQSVVGVKFENEIIYSSQIILATGGLSYAKTGATGDGYVWAEKLGHKLIPLTAALAPMRIDPRPPVEWSGVSLRDCVLACYSGGKKKAERQGDLLFTHIGISGPAVLELSRNIAEEILHNKVFLVVDTQPDLDDRRLDEIIKKNILEYPNKEIKSLVSQFLPNRMVGKLLYDRRIQPETRSINLNRSARIRIVKLLKEWELGEVTYIDLDKGEVTAGGISLKEINPKTMESRIVKGLFLCGEVLDIAGSIGGYNLQAAYSTGFVAGESAALDYIKKIPICQANRDRNC